MMAKEILYSEKTADIIDDIISEYNLGWQERREIVQIVGNILRQRSSLRDLTQSVQEKTRLSEQLVKQISYDLNNRVFKALDSPQVTQNQPRPIPIRREESVQAIMQRNLKELEELELPEPDFLK